MKMPDLMDVVGLVGLGMVAAGGWLLHPSVGLMLPGGILITIAAAAALRG